MQGDLILHRFSDQLRGRREKETSTQEELVGLGLGQRQNEHPLPLQPEEVVARELLNERDQLNVDDEDSRRRTRTFLTYE